MSIGKITDLLDTKIIDCRFVGARLDEINFRVFAHYCVFDHAKFHVFGRCFDYCTFENAKMSKMLVTYSTYTHCDFKNSDWRNTHALGHTFINCNWAGCKFGGGSFGSSRFVGTRPDPRTLGDTLMDDVVYE
jgi:uncharacterized protein YjbI with pentapeptide repeats